MNIANKTNFLEPSTPKFIKDSEFIQSFLKKKEPEFLSELMGISQKLADENWQRNQDWKSNPNEPESTSSVFAFTGEVYRGLDVKTLDKKSVEYLEENLRILSGLYGILKSSDIIMPYRLEMGVNFTFDKYKNLYSFWKDKVTEHLNSTLKKDDFLLNLASNEYSKVIDRKKLNAKIVDVDFYEIRDGKLKTIVVYTKHARGLVTRFCAENNVKTLDEVKAFNYENYLLDDNLSTENKLVFTRQQ